MNSILFVLLHWSYFLNFSVACRACLLNLRYLHGKLKCFAKILKIAKNKCKSRPVERTREQNVPGGTPLYKLYRYVPPHQVGFLRPFGLKTGVHFARIWYGFRGNHGIVWTYLSFQFQMSKKERKYVNSKNFFCLRSNLSNDNIISA